LVKVVLFAKIPSQPIWKSLFGFSILHPRVILNDQFVFLKINVEMWVKMSWFGTFCRFGAFLVAGGDWKQ